MELPRDDRRVMNASGRWTHLLVALLVSGCEFVNLPPPFVPPGGRVVIVTVENRSQNAGVLVVGEFRNGEKPAVPPPLVSVGTAQPSSVPPGSRVDVQFGVPAGSDWGIYVNPGPRNGVLVLGETVTVSAPDKPEFKIVIDADGEPWLSYPGDQFWSGAGG